MNALLMKTKSFSVCCEGNGPINCFFIAVSSRFLAIKEEIFLETFLLSTPPTPPTDRTFVCFSKTSRSGKSSSWLLTQSQFNYSEFLHCLTNWLCLASVNKPCRAARSPPSVIMTIDVLETVGFNLLRIDCTARRNVVL